MLHKCIAYVNMRASECDVYYMCIYRTNSVLQMYPAHVCTCVRTHTSVSNTHTQVFLILSPSLALQTHALHVDRNDYYRYCDCSSTIDRLYNCMCVCVCVCVCACVCVSVCACACVCVDIENTQYLPRTEIVMISYDIQHL